MIYIYISPTIYNQPVATVESHGQNLELWRCCDVWYIRWGTLNCAIFVFVFLRICMNIGWENLWKISWPGFEAKKKGLFWFSPTKLSKSDSSADTKAGLVSAGSFYQVRKERRSGRLPKKGVGRRRLTCLEHVWYNVVPPAYKFILSIHLTTLTITNKLLRNNFVCLVMACDHDLKLSTKKIKIKKEGVVFFACVRSKRRAA